MRTSFREKTAGLQEIMGILIVLVALVLLFALLSDKFLTVSNLFRILLNVSTIGVMALGEGLVIIVMGMDLSVGSTFALAGIITGMGITRFGLGVPASIALGVLSGAFIGAVNGLLILRAGLSAFIATFGMLSLIRGVAYAISGGYTVPVYTKQFTDIGMASLGPIPVPAIVFLASVAVFALVLRRTTFGAALFATGGNEKASFYSGIRTTRVKYIAYVLCGTLAAVAGILSTAKIGMASSTAGLNYEMDVITAVILGGVSLKGGKGSAIGIMLGAIIMGVIRNGLLIMGISAYYQTAIIGFIIIAVVVIDTLRSLGAVRLFSRKGNRA
jgi:ribose transport system permease protein